MEEVTGHGIALKFYIISEFLYGTKAFCQNFWQIFLCKNLGTIISNVDYCIEIVFFSDITESGQAVQRVWL